MPPGHGLQFLMVTKCQPQPPLSSVHLLHLIPFMSLHWDILYSTPMRGWGVETWVESVFSDLLTSLQWKGKPARSVGYDFMHCNCMMCNVKIFYLLCGKRLLSIHPEEFPPEKSTSKLLLAECRTLWGKHEQAACVVATRMRYQKVVEC